MDKKPVLRALKIVESASHAVVTVRVREQRTARLVGRIVDSVRLHSVEIKSVLVKRRARRVTLIAEPAHRRAETEPVQAPKRVRVADRTVATAHPNVVMKAAYSQKHAITVWLIVAPAKEHAEMEHVFLCRRVARPVLLIAKPVARRLHTVLVVSASNVPIVRRSAAISSVVELKPALTVLRIVERVTPDVAMVRVPRERTACLAPLIAGCACSVVEMLCVGARKHVRIVAKIVGIVRTVAMQRVEEGNRVKTVVRIVATARKNSVRGLGAKNLWEKIVRAAPMIAEFVRLHAAMVSVMPPNRVRPAEGIVVPVLRAALRPLLPAYLRLLHLLCPLLNPLLPIVSN